MTNTLVSIGGRIQQLRLKKKLTQSDLANGFCTPSMISQIEGDRARPSYKLLSALAQRLEVTLDELLDDVALDLEMNSAFKMAKAFLAAKEYGHAIPLYQQLLTKKHATISRKLLLLGLAQCFLYTERLQEAESLLSEIHAWASLRQDDELHAQFLYLSSQIAFKRKRYLVAVYLLQRALEEVEKVGVAGRQLRGDILLQLGKVQAKLGQVGDAAESFTLASEDWEGASHLQELGMTYLHMSETCQRSHDLERALDYSERAASIFDGLGRVMVKLQLQVEQAVLSGMRGDVDLNEAIETVRAVILKFRQHHHAEREGHACLALAKLLHKQGNLAAAEEAGRQAQFLLQEEKGQQGWIDYLFGEIAVQRDQGAEAMERFASAALHFQELEEYGAWADAQGEIAKLHATNADYLPAYVVAEEIRHTQRGILLQRGIVL